jgi:hypothetical protein
MRPETKPRVVLAIPLIGVPLVFSHSPRIKLVGELIVFGGCILASLRFALRPEMGDQRMTAELRWWTLADVALAEIGWFLKMSYFSDARMVGDLVLLSSFAVALRVLLLRHIGNYLPQEQAK